jgi:hypothetical protein
MDKAADKSRQKLHANLALLPVGRKKNGTSVCLVSDGYSPGMMRKLRRSGTSTARDRRWW